MRILSIVVLGLIVGCGPRSFEDCVLENLHGTETEAAVRLIHLACDRKFPKTSSLVPYNGTVIRPTNTPSQSNPKMTEAEARARLRSSTTMPKTKFDPSTARLVEE